MYLKTTTKQSGDRISNKQRRIFSNHVSKTFFVCLNLVTKVVDDFRKKRRKFLMQVDTNSFLM